MEPGTQTGPGIVFFGSSIDIQQWASAHTTGVSWLRMSIDESVNSAETDGRS